MKLIQSQQLMTSSLRSLPQGGKIAEILAHSVNSVNPTHCVREHLKRTGRELVINGDRVSLDQYRRVLLIGFGKASLPMTCATADIFSDKTIRGITVIKKGIHEDLSEVPRNIRIYKGGHPLPDRDGLEGTQEIIGLLSSTTEKDLVLFLISGGGSALLTAPAKGLNLEEVSRLNELLLRCGASINEINTIRKHISRVKGGRLADLAFPAPTISLILSDVIRDPLNMIASGPTLPDPTTFEEALSLISKYHLEEDMPSAVLAHLKNGELGKVPETPKAGDPVFKQGYVKLIGNNHQAAASAVEKAASEGFHTLHLTSCYQGEAREIGLFLGAVLRQMATTGDPLPRPACVVAGGEATVVLEKGRQTGRGGRNQELALSAIKVLDDLSDAVLLALATDGNDGPTDAAGAVVTGKTYQRASTQGLSLQAHLERHNAYAYFDALGDLLKPGLTQTNVNDLIYLFTL
ncbi:MAG: glycerate kinase [Anaerolineales bacterium]